MGVTFKVGNMVLEELGVFKPRGAQIAQRSPIMEGPILDGATARH
jgi:hypothetical protein